MMSSHNESNERRLHRRVRPKDLLSLEYRIDGSQETGIGYGCNVSLGGIFFGTYESLDKNGHLQIKLPASAANTGEIIFEAVVVRVHSPVSKAGIPEHRVACRISQIDEKNKELLQRWLSQEN